LRRYLLIGGVIAVVIVALAAGFFVIRSPQPHAETAAPAETGPAPAPRDTATPQIAAAGDWDPEITPFDKVLGAQDAPVTVIEYSSFTCGHCAAFHIETLPALKERYIDTGVLRLVFRDFPLDGLALRAGMLARCAPEDQYFSMVQVLFANQRQWATAADPVAALMSIGRLAGLSGETIQACLENEALADQIVALRLQGEQKYDIDATPTFIIGGEKVAGNLPLEDFAEQIELLASQN
jgi:protein-disulfide isomerase